ncbi:MAG: hypothetical protein PVF83_11440 [Anaerolineales bacterium]
MRIYLWGPTGSGKTWLTHAFIRKVNLLQDVLSNKVSPYKKVWITDKMGRTVERDKLEYKPTKRIEYQKLTYHRTIEIEGSISEFYGDEYEIYMLDGPGDETTGYTAIETNEEDDLSREKVMSAHETLKSSDYLIVTVNPGARGFLEDDQRKTTHTPNQVGKHFLGRLDALMNLKRNPKQQVILCFTMADIYGYGAGGVNAPLARFFGIHAGRIWGKLQELLSIGDIEPNIFFISAVGDYHDRSEELITNLDEGASKLKSEEHWNPDSVLEPFFTIFDHARKLQLEGRADKASGLLKLIYKVIKLDHKDTLDEYSNKKMLHGLEEEINKILYKIR